MVPEGWEEGRVGDLLEKLESGVSVNGEDRPLQPGEFGVLRVSSVTYGTFKPRAAKAIIPKDIARAKCNPRAGQIIISRSNTDELVGASAFVETDYPNLYLSDKLWQTVPKPHANMKWLSYVLASKHTRYLLSNLATGTSGSMKNITKDELLTLKASIPPVQEQKKIAQVLSTWDQAITATERLLENSRQRKKGLMQQLLTGKKRLVESDGQLAPKKSRTGYIPGDWEYPKIAEICSQITGKNSDDHQYPVLACSKHYGFVDSLSYFKKRVYSDDLTGYRIIPRGCIGFPANHVEEGSIGLQNLYDFGLVSPIYVVARPNPKKVNADYLYAVLKTDHYRQIFSAATNASVDRRGSLRWKEFSQIRIPLPPLAEQNTIAEFLKLTTRGIDVLESDLELLKQEKRSLMQQLLTGKRRVTVEADAA